MNPILNPFAPGAGTQPPELAGRNEILAKAEIALGRIKAGRSAKSQVLLGLRGVGKTVLLNRLDALATELSYLTVVLEAPEDRRLAEMLVPKLRTLLKQLSLVEKAKSVAKRALGVLRSFAGAFKVSAGDVEFGVQPEIGIADSGNLDVDLPELLLAVANAARLAERPIALFIDEVQYLSSGDLGALLASLHQVGQKGLPLILFGAGLPQLAALAGVAKSYAERLLDYPAVGPLPDEAAREAIQTPVTSEGVQIAEGALAMIVEKTGGYPYFLQEWGSHAWNAAEKSPITVKDVERATIEVLKDLDAGFFRVRLDRLTPREKDYLRAMAELGPGPHRSGEIAKALSLEVTAAGPLRNELIKKGMIFSPEHAQTAFTVPMFDDFMRRSVPNWIPSPAENSGAGRGKGKSKRKRK